MLTNEDLVVAFAQTLDLFRLAGIRRLKDPDNESKYFTSAFPWQKALLISSTIRVGAWFYHQGRAYRVAFDDSLAIYVDYDLSLDRPEDWFEILYGEDALPRPDPYDLYLFLQKVCPDYPFFSSFRFVQSSRWIKHATSKGLFPYYWDAFAPHERKLICEWLLSKDFRFPGTTYWRASSGSIPMPAS